MYLTAVEAGVFINSVGWDSPKLVQTMFPWVSNNVRFNFSMCTYGMLCTAVCTLLQHDDTTYYLQVFIDKGPYAGEKLQNDIR